ncbi:flagellar basal body P-ring formation chaperone FlgA [Limnohabitans sp. DM1]|uniref:flagellar basal body P-ring formation chaperone FlgA n=1 Tax=Limnohabitans sp. DM1 TaxID=1597955 RepID=UPI0021012448|nr:flagellar basal body P-ring formation chaperone FlgA [Limnohabitans sp. DM1]
MSTAQTENDWRVLTKSWIESELQTSKTKLPNNLRMEIQIGQLDTRLSLSPCQKVEPFMPAGTVLWGRSRIGLRCASQDARWQVFMPITVKAYGPALTLVSNLPAGTLLTSDHIQEAEVDWAANASPIVLASQEWLGKSLSRNVSLGEALRESMLKAPPTFAAGTKVKLLLKAPGFELASEGQSLSPGKLGEQVRVRLDNGRIVTGKVVDERTVWVSF